MIRSIFLIGLALLASLRSFAAGEVERLALVAKSWGIVKYYHPALASGRINADSLLLTMLQQVDDAGAEKTAEDVLLSIITRLGPVSSGACDSKRLLEGKEAVASFTWIDGLMNNALRGRLKELSNVRCDGKHVSLNATPNASQITSVSSKERGDTLPIPDLTQRYLALFRAWNAIKYFSKAFE